MNNEFKQFNIKIEKVKDWLKKELSTIRTGRATASLLDGVIVSSYGVNTPLIQLANIVSEDAKTLRVNPYDNSQIKDIEKAITMAELGVSLSVDDGGIRAIFPELTIERKEILVKQAYKKLEEARISIRTERDELWGKIQKKQKVGEISEDDKFRLKDEMQKSIDDLQDEFNNLTESKENEINS